MKKLVAAGAAFLALTGMQAPAQTGLQPTVHLWRLDCGDFVMKRFDSWFSDTFQYSNSPKKLVGSCYLIRHGSDYLLWDTGMSDALIAKPVDNDQQTMSLRTSILAQLKQIGVSPDQVDYVGISHFHGDHTGQAKHFPKAQLLIGKADWDELKSNPARKDTQEDLAPWITGGGKVLPVPGDRDVFEDGRVTMLAMPGHTPGHTALLVRLASGPVLLSGDQYHFTEAAQNHSVPSFNHDRADTLASHDRFDRITKNVGARIIIQHEPADIAKLPAFPKAAQ